MEEIEYLEEYEEIVMPQLVHNSIEEFLSTDDPYDLLPVDPAFDEFIEEDPLCSVYRNDFEFETTQANDIGNGRDTNNSATGAITTLSPTVTDSIVTLSPGDTESSTIVTGDIVTGEAGNMIIVHPGIQTTTTTTTLINVQSNSGNHQLEYIPTEIVETTVTYENDQQQNNIDNDDDNETITEIQNNNNENNIIYSNSYVTTSPTTIIHQDNNSLIGSGVKVLSCETLGTSAFLNVSGTTILSQSHLPITPIKQTSTIIDSPLNNDSGNNRLIGTTSEYIRATHSSNNSIHTNLSLLGLPLSPPALQYQISTSTPISLHQQTGNILHHHNQQQYNSPLSSTITNLQNYPAIIATNTTNRSKKSLSSILYNKNNDDFYPQLLALNSGLKKQRNLTDKFKTLFKNTNNENVKNSGFGKVKEYSMKKSNYRSKINKSDIIAIRASSFKREKLNFLYRSKEIQSPLPPPLLKSIHQQQYNNQNSNIDNYDNNEISTKMIIEKMIPIIPTKGAVKQYEVIEKTQQINDNNIHDTDEESLTTNNEQEELNEEYINDDETTILNDIDGEILTTSNPIDINNVEKILNKDEKNEDLKNTKYNLPLKATHSSYKIPLNDSDIISPKRPLMYSKFSKSMESLHNNSNNTTVLKIDKKNDTDLIIAKNTSLKIRQSKSLIPLKDSGNNGSSSNKFRNMMKSKFSKSMENITKCLRDEQKIKQKSAIGGDDKNEIKAISVGGFKKTNFSKLCKKSNVANTTTVTTTNDITNKQKLCENNNKNDEKHHNKYDTKLSPIRTNKSKAQIINDVLNSPKVLRVVIPRTLEQTSSMNNKLKENLNNVVMASEKSNISSTSSSDLNCIKKNYNNDDEQQQQKESRDPLKLTDIDPLQLDNDVDDAEIISHLQNIDNKKNKKIDKITKNNDDNDHKNSTPIDEFELFAKQQKLIKTMMNTDKRYLKRCRSVESSESPILFRNNIKSSSTTTTLNDDKNSCSSKLMIKDVVNKLNDNEINKSNDLKTTIINYDNLNEKANKNDSTGRSAGKNSKHMNRNRHSKSSAMNQKNNIILKENDNIKDIVKDKEIINKKPPENLILTKKSSDQEKIQGTSTTTASTITTKSQISTTTKKSLDQEKNQEPSIETATVMCTKPQILTLMKKSSSSQEKIQEPQTNTSPTSTRKQTVNKTLTYTEKSSNKEKIKEEPTTTNVKTTAKPEISISTKKSSNREKIPGETLDTKTTTTKPELLILTKTTPSQEKIPEKVTPSKPSIIKPLTRNSLNQGEKIITSTATIQDCNHAILTKTTPSQEKIPEKVTPSKPSIIKPLTRNSLNQDEKIITSTATIQEKPVIELNKSFDITNTTTTFELVRSKRIASRNQSSTDSHPSSLKEISFDNKDHIEPISQLISRSKIRNSRSSSSSDQLKTVNTSPKIDIDTKSVEIMKPRSRNMKKLKTDEDNQDEANSRRKRSLSKSRHQIKNIEEAKSDISSTIKEYDNEKNVATSEMKFDNNESTKIDDNGLTPAIVHFPHLSRRRPITDEGTKNNIQQLIGINDSSLKEIEPVEASINSAQQIGVVNKDIHKNDNNEDKLNNITLRSGKDNKETKLTGKDIHKNRKEMKKHVAKEEDNNANTNVEQKNKKDNVKQIENIDMEMGNKKVETIEESSKKDSENLTTFEKPPETLSVTDIVIEFKKPIQQQPISKSESDKEKEAELKAIRRRNRELKLLEIDNNIQHIFVEPTMTGLRTRSKRRTDGNAIQIATKKPVAKVICRRRQSNLIQISRKEYDRVVNERRAAAAEDANKKEQETITQLPPVLIPYHVDNEQPANFSEVLEYEKDNLKKNIIKKCKIVLEKTPLTYKKSKILKSDKLNSSTTKIKEKNKDGLPKVFDDATVTTNNSNQTMNNVDSNASPTITKKRKLNISVEKEIISEPKIPKKSDDLHLRQENTESVATKKINHPEEICTTNLILSKPSNDNSTKIHSADYDKLNKSKLIPTVIVELPKLDKTISQATVKNKQPPTTTELMELKPVSTPTSKNKSTKIESIVTTVATITDSPKVLEELTKKSDITKTTKSNEKIRISSRFLPLKIDNNKKNYKDYSRTSLKRYKSTPNLNLLNDDANNQSKKKLTTEKTTTTTTTSQKNIELNQVATRCLRNKESTNLSITHTESELTKTPTKISSNSKRKLSESQLISGGGGADGEDVENKKQKLSSNDKKSTITEEVSSLKNLTEIIELRKEDNQLNAMDQTTNSSSPIVQQNHIISKPQIFIAAPENISRRRNSESNLGDNNNEKNSTSSGLDFSIESWFQDIPPPTDIDNVEIETLTTPTDIIPELNEILTSTTNSADENDDIAVEPLVSRLTPPVLPIAISTKLNSQIFNSMTKTKTYWPLKPTQQQQTQLQTTSTHNQHSPQITCTPDISSYSITNEPSTFNIPKIKSINIPAHIVVQTKFLTREQYMSKLRKNPINVSSTTNSTGAATNALINNTIITSTNISSSSTGIGNKNSSDQRSSAKILERISDLLETQIDTEVNRKLKDFIENKTAEDQLRIERLANINKIGYTSDFGLQMLVFLQNYFFNTPTVMDNIRNIRDTNNSNDGGSINTRNIEKQLPIKSSNISGIEDFSFRRIRLPPVQNINNNNNNLQQKLPNRTALQSNLNKNNSPIIQNKYPNTGIINICPNNAALQNNNRLLNISSNNTLNDIGQISSLTLRQSTTGQGTETNTEVFLNSTNNTCEPAITNEPESILPDDNQIIAAPQLLETDIKEEAIEESITS